VVPVPGSVIAQLVHPNFQALKNPFNFSDGFIVQVETTVLGSVCIIVDVEGVVTFCRSTDEHMPELNRVCLLAQA
jgi:hypothetical protein